jgi:8-oxo-dGTP pyrophosphatase MutT (NUDIX family)
MTTDEKRGPWSIRSRRTAYDNQWIHVTHHEVTTPGGTEGIYGAVHFKQQGVSVVPVDAEGYTYLVGQYRFMLGRYCWEIPAGGGALDTEPLDVAARELQEETGLRARQWRRLLECDLSSSITDERSVAFLAWDLITDGDSSPEPTELLTIRRLPLQQAFDMVAEGEIRDAVSVITLQAVRLLQLENRLPF